MTTRGAGPSTPDTLLSLDDTSGSFPIDTTPDVVAGRYEVLGLLGAGGMGRVYRARDRELDELVALKVLTVEATDEPGAIERFRREARLARHVTHRNVVRLFDIGEDTGLRFITMELVDGESLAAVLERGGPLPIGRVIDVGIDVCAGLEAAHQAGVVHRDLKPGNVLLARDGRVVLTDFGIATSVADAATSALTGGLAIGTPDYMAPEQVEASGEIDARADVFALGAMLYEMLVGEPPWSGKSSMAIAIARLLVAAPDPSLARADVPAALSALVLRCLARRREDRFGAASEVALALVAIARPTTGAASAPAHDRGAEAVLAFGAPVAGLKTVAVLPFRNAGTPEDAYVADGLTEDLADTLSITPGLRVRAGGVVSAAVSAGGDPREVGRALGVQVVVEGSVRRIPDGLRVSARLVGVSDGFQLWAGRFDRPSGDLLVVSDEVARAIAEALATQVLGPERHAATDAEAVDLYLRARHEYRDRFSTVAALRCVELFAAAVLRAPADPTFLSAYAMALVRVAWHVDDSRAQRALAAQVAERAVALAPHLAQPYVALGMQRLNDGHTADAARALAAAVRRNPTSPEAHEALGALMVEAGLVDEGLRHLEVAYGLDPTSQLSCAWLSRVHFLLGHREESLEWLRRVEAPGLRPMVALHYGRMAAADRDPVAARRMLDELAADPAAEPTLAARGVLERVITGRLPDASRELMARLVTPLSEPRRRALGHQLLAELTALDGDEAAVLDEIELAVDAGLFDVLWMDRSPPLELVRKSARFAALRARVGEAAAAVARATIA